MSVEALLLLSSCVFVCVPSVEEEKKRKNASAKTSCLHFVIRYVSARHVTLGKNQVMLGMEKDARVAMETGLLRVSPKVVIRNHRTRQPDQFADDPGCFKSL